MLNDGSGAGPHPFTDRQERCLSGGMGGALVSAGGQQGWGTPSLGNRPEEAAGAGLVVVAGPSGQSLSALVRQVISGTGAAARPYRFVLAEDRSVLEQSLSRFAGELAGAFVVLGIALVGAAWLQVRIGLLPLGALRRGVEAVRRGEASDLPGAYPAELLPLVGEVNDLLRTQEQSIGFARARASDLAHGLKTPLQVLGGLGERARARGDVETGGEIEALAAEMRARIDYSCGSAGCACGREATLCRASCALPSSACSA